MSKSSPEMSSPSSPSSSFESSKMAITIAKEVHTSLYGTNPNYQHTVISNYYRQDAKFEDPIVSVTGIPNILSQFRFLCAFSAIEVKVQHIAASTTIQKGARSATDVVTIDSITTFRAAFIPLKVRILSRFEFDENLQIVLHEDVWSVADLIGHTSLIGSAYNVFRRVNGTCSSFLIDRVLWAVERFGGREDEIRRVPNVPSSRREGTVLNR